MLKKTMIVDGYNIIFEFFKDDAEEGLEKARDALALIMRNWENRHTDTHICIVFDGKECCNRTTKLHNVDCVFTKKETGSDSADNYIIAMLRDSPDPSQITVISNDNKIGNACRAFGAIIYRLKSKSDLMKHVCKRPEKKKRLKLQQKCSNPDNRHLIDEVEKARKIIPKEALACAYNDIYKHYLDITPETLLSGYDIDKMLKDRQVILNEFSATDIKNHKHLKNLLINMEEALLYRGKLKIKDVTFPVV